MLIIWCFLAAVNTSPGWQVVNDFVGLYCSERDGRITDNCLGSWNINWFLIPMALHCYRSFLCFSFFLKREYRSVNEEKEVFVIKLTNVWSFRRYSDILKYLENRWKHRCGPSVLLDQPGDVQRLLRCFLEIARSSKTWSHL